MHYYLDHEAHEVIATLLQFLLWAAEATVSNQSSRQGILLLNRYH